MKTSKLMVRRSHTCQELAPEATSAVGSATMDDNDLNMLIRCESKINGILRDVILMCWKKTWYDDSDDRKDTLLGKVRWRR